MKILGKLRMKKRSYAKQKAIWGFIYVLPWLLGFVFFFLSPLITSLRYSFSKVAVNASGITITNAGL